MNGINEKVEIYQKKQRIIKYSIYFIIVSISLFFIYTLYLKPREKGIEVDGVVERLVGIPSEEGEELYLSVRLHNGKLVKARIYNVSRYKKGSKVVLVKRKSRLLGTPVYGVRRYID